MNARQHTASGRLGKPARRSRSAHSLWTAVTCGLLFGAVACSTATAPPATASHPTLSVSNPFCDSAGNCTPLGVAIYLRSWLGHVSDSAQAGVWLGYVQGSGACFAIPSADTLVKVVGAADTTRYIWTPSNPQGAFVGVFGFGVPMAVSHTFIPGRSLGWRLQVLDSVPYLSRMFWAPVSKTEACTPGS